MGLTFMVWRLLQSVSRLQHYPSRAPATTAQVVDVQGVCKERQGMQGSKDAKDSVLVFKLTARIPSFSF